MRLGVGEQAARDGWNQNRPELCLHDLKKAKRSFSHDEENKQFQVVRFQECAKKSAPAVTVSRNTPLPRPAAPRREITHEMIAKRAYEIYRSGAASDQLGNWLRAERELRAV